VAPKFALHVHFQRVLVLEVLATMRCINLRFTLNCIYQTHCAATVNECSLTGKIGQSPLDQWVEARPCHVSCGLCSSLSLAWYTPMLHLEK